ncbi:MAG: SIMPL domain-containing protein [Bacteroidota bacterium]|nr:SIMPL domain-containing protein [Bacteroidota bacterium]MDP4274618.1 SIMPL domain-containing protein [Bacteroidota bacterium]
MKKLVLIYFALYSIAAFGQENTTLALSGAATKKVLPDRFIVNIALTSEGKSQKEGYNGLNELSAFVLNELKEMKFTQEQIKLTDYSFFTRNIALEKAHKETRYFASQNISIDFKLDKERILKLYNTLLDNNKKGISLQFSTSISDSLKEKIGDELLVSAIFNTQKKAKLIASTSKLKIRNIKNITYNTTEDSSNEDGYIRFTPPVIKADDDVKISENANFFSINEIALSDEIKITYYLEK